MVIYCSVSFTILKSILTLGIESKEHRENLPVLVCYQNSCKIAKNDYSKFKIVCQFTYSIRNSLILNLIKLNAYRYWFDIYLFAFLFQVSATFAASLVTSPALGAYLGKVYSDNFVIWLATAIAVLDVLFILVMVPESLPDKLRTANWGSQISWEKADPLGVSCTSAYLTCRCFKFSFFHFQIHVCWIKPQVAFNELKVAFYKCFYHNYFEI